MLIILVDLNRVSHWRDASRKCVLNLKCYKYTTLTSIYYYKSIT